MRCYMGRFRVPYWLFRICPPWMHRLADKFGGLEPCKCVCHDQEATAGG